MRLSRVLGLYALVCTASALTVDDLHAHYAEIFPSQNRNAASHKWATYALQHATSAAEAVGLFKGFCPVSGSPLSPIPSKTYEMALPTVADPSAHSEGLVYFCCSPCVCDATDFLRVDTYEYKGESLRVLVVGDPCIDEEALFAAFTDPFDGQETTLRASAPEVGCTAEGKLEGATMSDRGHPIVGIMHDSGGGEERQDGAAIQRDTCAQRADGGYDSGMGYIFRQFGEVNPIGGGGGGGVPADKPPVTGGVWRADPSCGQIDDAKRSWLEGMVNANSVVLVGLSNARCTAAAEASLQEEGACVETHHFASDSDPLWSFLQCMYPEAKVGGMMMHSYVWVGAIFVGQGFDVADQHADGTLAAALASAGADTSCEKDTAECASLLPAEEIAEMERVIAGEAVVLYGWSGCPCTSIARTRFTGEGVCYVETVWPSDSAPAFKYLQCVYGEEHHSFLFFGGAFKGNGFMLEEQTTPDAAFDAMLDEAGARLTCQKEGDKSLSGGALQSCTQSADGSTTGWTRSGSCNWDPSDAGFHQVCVTMSAEFLHKSATEDANDLSSVVAEGGHWCICAWAFAAAVQRDPENLEGIVLDCERTNQRLVSVYETYHASSEGLTSPSGKQYEAYAPLQRVLKLCPSGEGSAEEQSGEPTAPPSATPPSTSTLPPTTAGPTTSPPTMPPATEKPAATNEASETPTPSQSKTAGPSDAATGEGDESTAAGGLASSDGNTQETPEGGAAPKAHTSGGSSGAVVGATLIVAGAIVAVAAAALAYRRRRHQERRRAAAEKSTEFSQFGIEGPAAAEMKGVVAMA